eukprot:TRINITY_DN14629_c0_g1_i1.p1 TRINITY_DN14629_c0_g1~~TRINITY_DN14629_c0_g1_i1.p1  ORF type:complete len:592 (-),score=167.69 TRINITY_DN14629_c0_g1_i1:103-1878(-)
MSKITATIRNPTNSTNSFSASSSSLTLSSTTSPLGSPRSYEVFSSTSSLDASAVIMTKATESSTTSATEESTATTTTSSSNVEEATTTTVITTTLTTITTSSPVTPRPVLDSPEESSYTSNTTTDTKDTTAAPTVNSPSIAKLKTRSRSKKTLIDTAGGSGTASASSSPAKPRKKDRKDKEKERDREKERNREKEKEEKAKERDKEKDKDKDKDVDKDKDKEKEKKGNKLRSSKEKRVKMVPLLASASYSSLEGAASAKPELLIIKGSSSSPGDVYSTVVSMQPEAFRNHSLSLAPISPTLSFNSYLPLKASHDDPIVKLNVGGKKISTKCSTLTQIKGSFLASLFSTHMNESNLELDEEGYVFLDYNPQCFQKILDFLRAIRLCDPDRVEKPVIPDDIRQDFEILAKHLGVADVIGIPVEIIECFSFKYRSEDIMIHEKGLVIEHGILRNGFEFAFGERVYTQGIVQFTFKVEHMSNGSFSFFGIIGAGTKPEGGDTPYLKTSYGWGFPDRVYINGLVYNNYGGFRVDALQQNGNIINLTLNMRTNTLSFEVYDQLKYSIQIEPQPWRLHVSLSGLRDRVRILQVTHASK